MTSENSDCPNLPGPRWKALVLPGWGRPAASLLRLASPRPGLCRPRLSSPRHTSQQPCQTRGLCQSCPYGAYIWVEGDRKQIKYIVYFIVNCIGQRERESRKSRKGSAGKGLQLSVEWEEDSLKRRRLSKDLEEVGEKLISSWGIGNKKARRWGCEQHIWRASGSLCGHRDERRGEELEGKPEREQGPERTERPMTFTFTLWQVELVGFWAKEWIVLYVATELLYLLSWESFKLAAGMTVEKSAKMTVIQAKARDGLD